MKKYQIKTTILVAGSVVMGIMIMFLIRQNIQISVYQEELTTREIIISDIDMFRFAMYYHGADTIYFEKDVNEWYFVRDGVKCILFTKGCKGWYEKLSPEGWDEIYERVKFEE